MARAAESPEPGTLVHPAYGNQRVSCVSLGTSLQYLKEKRRTKLSFEFIEANDSSAPFATGTTVPMLMQIGSQAVAISQQAALWIAAGGNADIATQLSLDLAQLVAPANDEDSFDAISMLEIGAQSAISAPPRLGVSTYAGSASTAAIGGVYMTFTDVSNPIVNGTATIRQIHDDALIRLCAFNADVVNASVPGNSSVESLVMTSRLALIRDYALVTLQTTYPTIKAALDDLDFITAIYDEEELAAAARGNDELVTAIRAARAAAESGILQQNIRLPGLLEFSVDGVWPSLVCAQKIYADGKRYMDFENYSPQSPPFFIGRSAVAPAT
jgi:prophage DNA circulation protein